MKGMKKEYVSPAVDIVDVELESLLTTFSNGGSEIEGPVGAKPHGSLTWDWDMPSVWDDGEPEE